jgi:hypothetical protein
MKPLNLDNRPCSPISSNCVVWQGPTLTCIDLCTGDSISDVVAKLATELCTLLDQTNVSDYDLTCLGITACGPKDFQALIQLLINKICELEGIPTDGTRTETTCPDCIITVKPCFVQNGQTTMQLIDYIQMIAQKVCDLITEIGDLQTQIDNLDIRVTVLENTPPPSFTLPTITPDCTLSDGIIVGGQTYPMDQVLNALINDNTYGYCALVGVTGTPSDLGAAVASQCIDSSTSTLSKPPIPFGTQYLGTWVSSPETVADSITNLWIVVCDMYTAFQNYDPPTSVVTAGEGITINSATVGDVTTYTVTNDYLESFVANVTINTNFAPGSGVIPKVTPSSVNGVQEGQVIFRYTSVASNGQLVVAGAASFVPNGSLPSISFGTFDNTTGLFTITDPGMYLIVATIHLKPDTGSTVFWSGTGTTVGDIGSFLIGIHPNNNTDTFVSNGQALIPNVDRNVEISTSKVIAATNPTQLRVKVLNTTNRDYDGTGYPGADSISFSITKLRSGLTITNL